MSPFRDGETEPRELKRVAQGHTAGTWQGQDLNLGSLILSVWRDGYQGPSGYAKDYSGMQKIPEEQRSSIYHPEARRMWGAWYLIALWDGVLDTFICTPSVPLGWHRRQRPGKKKPVAQEHTLVTSMLAFGALLFSWAVVHSTVQAPPRALHKGLPLIPSLSPGQSLWLRRC